MANVVRDPQKGPDVIIPDLSTNKTHPFAKEDVALVLLPEPRFASPLSAAPQRIVIAANTRAHRL